LDFIEEFNFELMHRAGTSHGNADALSRMTPCEREGGPCKQCDKMNKTRCLDTPEINCLAVQTRGRKRTFETEPKQVTTQQQNPYQKYYPPRPAPAPVQHDAGPAVEDTHFNDTICYGPADESPPDANNEPAHETGADHSSSLLNNNDHTDPSSMPAQPTTCIKRPATMNNDDGLDEQPSRRKRRRLRYDKQMVRAMEPWTDTLIAKFQNEDTNLRIVKPWVEAGSRPNWQSVRGCSPAVKTYWHQFDSLIIANGVLHRHREDSHDILQGENSQLVMPEQLKEEFLELVHTRIAGHLGAMKTRAHVGRRAYWYQWRLDVDIYCKKCVTCNEFHRGRGQPKQGKLNPMVMGAPFERWSIDLAGAFPKSSSGHLYIFTAICAFSKYIVLVPIRDKTAITVAKVIYDRIFLTYGAGEILTDNGGEFRNELLSELCRLMGVARAFTTAYEARTNAVCERSHATINSMLAKCIAENQRDWATRLPYVQFCYNASTHESTGYTPYFLVHGTQPRWDVDFKFNRPDDKGEYSPNDFASLLLDRLEGAHELAREQLQTTAVRLKDYYDRKVHVNRFNVGDIVYVLNLRMYPGRCPKWIRRYSDEAVVLKRINDVTYQVRGEQWTKKTRIVHVDKLKLKQAACPVTVSE
jgi:transposase InsO family protein